jgi:hypothetical protein
VAVALAMGVAGGCGGSSGSGEEAVDLEFVRADGSVATFPETVRAWCAPFDDDNPDAEAVHVFAGELSRSEPAEPFWMLSAVRADAEREPTTLPNDFAYTAPRGATLFALDRAEHASNELSSAEEESSGTIRVQLTGCEPGSTVRVEFEHVTLGSEFHDSPTVSVDGVAEAEIGSPP